MTAGASAGVCSRPQPPMRQIVKNAANDISQIYKTAHWLLPFERWQCVLLHSVL